MTQMCVFFHLFSFLFRCERVESAILAACHLDRSLQAAYKPLIWPAAVAVTVRLPSRGGLEEGEAVERLYLGIHTRQQALSMP